MTGFLPRWPESWQAEMIVFSSNTSLVSWISSMPSISSSSSDLALADPDWTAPNGWGEFSAVIVTVEQANPGDLLVHRTSGECCSCTVMSLPSNCTALGSPVLTEEEDDDGDCRKNKKQGSYFFFSLPIFSCALSSSLGPGLLMAKRPCRGLRQATEETKGLFTWRWGTPGRWGSPLRWGNPPVNIISHFDLITFTW